MTGPTNHVRVGTRAIGEGTCPDYLAAKARPALWPAAYVRTRPETLDTFPLGIVNAALDEIECNGATIAQAVDLAVEEMAQQGKRLHPAALIWVRTGMAQYLAGAARYQERVPPGSHATVLVRDYWVAREDRRESGGRLWEMYAYGRRYESLDGSVREIRLLHYGIFDPLQPAQESQEAQGQNAGDSRKLAGHAAQEAIAAYSTAFGVPAPWPRPWREPFRPSRVPRPPAGPVRLVRVVQVGLADGEHHLVFEGTPAEVKRNYDAHGADQVRRAVRRGTPQPGGGCAQCKLRTACEALAPFPGILGITDPGAPPRTWSATSGRYYGKCPAQAHLYRLHLPRVREYSESAKRGQAVHAWLERAHGAPGPVPCTVRDIPATPNDWSIGGWSVSGDEARRGALMLASHAEMCPFHRADQIAEVRVEPLLAVHDTAANVIVTARPDVLYLENGSWVWRETKSRARPLRLATDLLTEFPQLALGMILLAENLLEGKSAGMRVELEMLYPHSSDMILLDPNDHAHLARAREVIHDLAAPWHTDEAAAPKPGPPCRTCPVHQWCPDALPLAGAGLAPDGDDEEDEVRE
jgi:PD-(D/E)XK nuclease superfamily protein